MNEQSYLLQDEITGDWVIVAPGRKKRPDGLLKPEDVFSPRSLKDQNVLAVYDSKGFSVTAVANNFPVLDLAQGVRGQQEILVEGDDVRSFVDFSVSEVAAVLQTYAERALLFRKNPKLKFMVTFKNQGFDAGASQPHPHSQIFATTFVPKRVQHRTNLDLHKAALLQATSARIIFKDKQVIAFANPTGRFAYEVRLLPMRKFDNITQATAAERLSFAKAMHSLFPLIRERKLSFNYFFHDVFADKKEPFEIRFAPRGNRWGGFELDAGIFVNSVPAEFAAGEYRAAKINQS